MMEHHLLGPRSQDPPADPRRQPYGPRVDSPRPLLVGFVEWSDGLSPHDGAWTELAMEILDARLDLLVTNELPFGTWPGVSGYDEASARALIRAHEVGIEALSLLGLPAIITSRPVKRGARLGHEAIIIDAGGIRPLRGERYFREEPGWLEHSWFEPGPEDFCLVEAGGVRVGVLLGSELMFTERARALGRQGADIIAVPRTSGPSPIWATAGAMAAITSGAYVVSSNRSGGSLLGVAFGGRGFAYSPGGTLIAQTSDLHRLSAVSIDLDRVRRQKVRYPCSVDDPGTA